LSKSDIVSQSYSEKISLSQFLSQHGGGVYLCSARRQLRDLKGSDICRRDKFVTSSPASSRRVHGGEPGLYADNTDVYSQQSQSSVSPVSAVDEDSLCGGLPQEYSSSSACASPSPNSDQQQGEHFIMRPSFLEGGPIMC